MPPTLNTEEPPVPGDPPPAPLPKPAPGDVLQWEVASDRGDVETWRGRVVISVDDRDDGRWRSVLGHVAQVGPESGRLIRLASYSPVQVWQGTRGLTNLGATAVVPGEDPPPSPAPVEGPVERRIRLAGEARKVLAARPNIVGGAAGPDVYDVIRLAHWFDAGGDPDTGDLTGGVFDDEPAAEEGTVAPKWVPLGVGFPAAPDPVDGVVVWDEWINVGPAPRSTIVEVVPTDVRVPGYVAVRAPGTLRNPVYVPTGEVRPYVAEEWK